MSKDNNKKLSFLKLSLDDIKVWEGATQNIKKITSKKVKNSHVEVHKSPEIIRKHIVFTPRVPHIKGSMLELGSKSNLTKKSTRRIDQGKASIDAVLDLHGLNETQAFEQLVSFIEKSYLRRLQLLLVITGKGSVSKPSIIKNRLPEWLNSKRLLPFVLRFSQASIKHGGGGAFYLYIRKLK